MESNMEMSCTQSTLFSTSQHFVELWPTLVTVSSPVTQSSALPESDAPRGMFHPHIQERLFQNVQPAKFRCQSVGLFPRMWGWIQQLDREKACLIFQTYIIYHLSWPQRGPLGHYFTIPLTSTKKSILCALSLYLSETDLLKCLNISSILFGITINNTDHNKLLLCNALKINFRYIYLNVL